MTGTQRTEWTTIGLALSCLAAIALTGCASGPTAADRLADQEPRATDAWLWTQPERYDFQPQPGPRGTHDASIAVFSGTPAQIASAETFRRDDLMGARADEALPDRLAWPREPSPDLRRQWIYRGSVDANRWVFPSTRRDGYRGHRAYNFRSGY